MPCSAPSLAPLAVTKPGSWVTMAPISTKICRMASPGWVVLAGQRLMVTRPPVTAAAARKGVALDRSGSMVHSRPAIGPGCTVHVFSPESTRTPACRSMPTVISTCGMEGRGAPLWVTVMPCAKRAPASKSPETNCDDPEASMVTSPPSGAPCEHTLKGRLSPSTSTPSWRSASRVVDMGRA